MMRAKWFVLVAVTAATLTNGCMAFQGISGHGRESSSPYDGGDAAIAERAPTRIDDAANRMDEAASRSEAAADRAAAAAARASVEAEKSETRFHKSLNK